VEDEGLIGVGIVKPVRWVARYEPNQPEDYQRLENPYVMTVGRQRYRHPFYCELIMNIKPIKSEKDYNDALVKFEEIFNTPIDENPELSITHDFICLF